ncbi:MAG: hypothetical protein PHZ24_06280 [Bacteroidales bacterium]|nr:hypothetical protein [Bacteroidales bacterium]MDY0141226.1 hypothetical protein [Bacteroidales bacterium]
MKKNHLLRSSIILFAMMLSAGTISAQLNLAPKVTDITRDNEFVLVTKSNPKFEKPERVVNTDFKVGEEAFDPYKLNTYTTWRFKGADVINHDGTITHYVAVINTTTGMYYHRSGDMKTSEEYEKAVARGETGSWIDFWKAMEFHFQPEVREWPYIWLRIPNKDKKNLVVTPMSWNTRDFKLVLVK